MQTNNKLWEALAEIRLLLVRVPMSIKPNIACGIINAKVKCALAEPPRNCDIGTAEEQAQRFFKFCKKNQSPIQGMCDTTCPCKHQPDMCHCYAKWSQMPYEKESEVAK